MRGAILAAHAGARRPAPETKQLPRRDPAGAAPGFAAAFFRETMKTESVNADIAPDSRPTGAGATFTLRARGILAFVALVLYVVTVGYILSQERQKLLRLSTEMEQLYAQEIVLAKATYSVAHSINRLQEKFFAAELSSSFEEEIALDIELVQSGLQGVLAYQPALAGEIERLERNVAGLRLTRSRSAMLELRDTERELDARLDQVTRQVRGRRGVLWDSYREVYDTMTVIAVIMGLLGAVFFGAAMTLFLTRLAWDIKKLAARAVDIVSGYRGTPLHVTRHDEVGELMRAVNRMQSELRRSEQRAEISRQQHFHQEKMAAIGSLAAAVAHEINNPNAAIAGIAESMKSAGRRAVDTADAGRSELILEQTRRMATISRHLAELTAPHSLEPELVDVNALVRNTCGFIAYDKRFGNIDLVLDLDFEIPAIEAVADHLTQVLMNLLINAADALEGCGECKPTIRVATQASDSEVSIAVHDNGKGMERAVLARAFEESFTTKPPDRGRGLGLFLCKSLIEGRGNRITLESTPGAGTTARIHLTLTQPLEVERS